MCFGLSKVVGGTRSEDRGRPSNVGKWLRDDKGGSGDGMLNKHLGDIEKKGHRSLVTRLLIDSWSEILALRFHFAKASHVS